MLARWFFTVPAARNSSAAISLLVAPRTTRVVISSSRRHERLGVVGGRCGQRRGEVAQQAYGQLRAGQRVAGNGGPDRLGEQRWTRPLEHEAGGPVAQCGGVLVEVERGDDNDSDWIGRLRKDG